MKFVCQIKIKISRQSRGHTLNTFRKVQCNSMPYCCCEHFYFYFLDNVEHLVNLELASLNPAILSVLIKIYLYKLLPDLNVLCIRRYKFAISKGQLNFRAFICPAIFMLVSWSFCVIFHFKHII